jgi:choline dehydrogenase-like flavoprotein
MRLGHGARVVTVFHDARAVPSGSVVESDVCIVGAGAAGITIARDLVGGRARVCLLESGDLAMDPATQELYRGVFGQRLASSGGAVVDGRPYAALESTRLRYFGGATNHWEGWCAPLTAIDFEARSWVPHSGWPLTLAELEPFYRRAQRVNQIGPFDYRPEKWTTSRRPTLDAGQDLETVMWQFSPPTRYGEVYRDELRRAHDLDVFLNANLTGFVTNGPHQVEALTVTTLAGTSFRVEAKFVVLACGGIENARILLLAMDDDAQPLAASRDVVGRFFMEHPHVEMGLCVFSDPAANLDLYTRRRLQSTGITWVDRVVNRIKRSIEMVEDPVRTQAGLRISDEAQRRERILNAVGILSPANQLGALGRAVQRTISIAASPESNEAPGYRIRVMLEQAPNPDSRVVLSDERDSLGQRRPRLEWQLSQLDTHTLSAATRRLALALGQADLGRARFERWVIAEPETWQGVYGGGHHMGTTRMSDDQKLGVVDRDCRVHGVGNLFVAGSSVFPTCGFANPTLTITALAHRLADHLKSLVS